jgi:pyruvate dehydrogenase E2 component (dihydrolipoamide acetyltransferase)
VFVHGFGGDLNNWLFNQEALAEHHTVYTIDLPGHGGSSKDVGAGDLASMTAALAAWLDALKIARAHLVGHSMGGAISLQLAAGKPDMVASATLICSAGLGPDISMDINGFIEASRGKKLEPVLQMLVANPALVTRDMIEDVLKFKRIDGVEAALRKMRDAIFPGGRQADALRDSLDKVKAPVQVIVGAQDRVIPSAAHAKGLPGNVKVHVIDNAGHMPHMEASSEVNRLIAEIAG